MAIKSVRVGPVENAVQFDDGEYDSAIETTEKIIAGSIEYGTMPAATPTDSDLLVFRDVSNNDELSTCTFAQLKTYLGL